MHHWRRAAFTPKVRKNVAAKCSPNLFLSKILFASSVLKFLGAVESLSPLDGRPFHQKQAGPRRLAQSPQVRSCTPPSVASDRPKSFAHASARWRRGRRRRAPRIAIDGRRVAHAAARPWTAAPRVGPEPQSKRVMAGGAG